MLVEAVGGGGGGDWIVLGDSRVLAGVEGSNLSLDLGLCGVVLVEAMTSRDLRTVIDRIRKESDRERYRNGAK